MKTNTDIEEFIKEKTIFLNKIPITDVISEEYIKQICEEYYKLKQEVNEYIAFLKMVQSVK